MQPCLSNLKMLMKRKKRIKTDPKVKEEAGVGVVVEANLKATLKAQKNLRTQSPRSTPEVEVERDFQGIIIIITAGVDHMKKIES